MLVPVSHTFHKTSFSHIFQRAFFRENDLSDVTMVVDTGNAARNRRRNGKKSEASEVAIEWVNDQATQPVETRNQPPSWAEAPESAHQIYRPRGVGSSQNYRRGNDNSDHSWQPWNNPNRRGEKGCNGVAPRAGGSGASVGGAATLTNNAADSNTAIRPVTPAHQMTPVAYDLALSGPAEQNRLG